MLKLRYATTAERSSEFLEARKLLVCTYEIKQVQMNKSGCTIFRRRRQSVTDRLVSCNTSVVAEACLRDGNYSNYLCDISGESPNFSEKRQLPVLCVRQDSNNNHNV